MKTLLTLFILIALSISSKAQRTISLEEANAYKSTPDGIPEDVSYVKDLNNSLPKFVGVWKGTADGKTVELHLKRHLRLPETSEGLEVDKITGRLLITNASTGEVLYNTLNITNDNKTYLTGLYIYTGIYVMYFSNKDTECYDDGDVHISVNSTTLTNMTMHFYRTKDIILEGSCPNINTYVPILPKEVKLVKQ